MSHTSRNQIIPAANQGTHDRGRILRAVLDIVVRYILPFVALAAGVLITIHLLQTGPQARQRPVQASGIMVNTTTVEYGSYPTVIQAMGVVKAAKMTELKPQVSGQVLSVSDQLIPGGRFAEGDTLLQLDSADYRLALIQRENAVVEAQNNLDIETGNQLVVKREYALLNEQVREEEKRLMLRQPQLSTLQSKRSIAESQKEQAELNLARTKIHAPYNGVVQELNVNIGTWVSSSSVLATLVGSDSYWAEVSVPEDQLQWVNVPAGVDEQGSTVRIFNTAAWGEDIWREGHLIRLLPGLETQGRMARLLIEIDDPLALKTENYGKPQMMLDSYVRVEIEGKPLAHAVTLPREYLRNGNQIWVYDEAGKLAIRDVSIGFKNRDNVLVTAGIDGGEKIVTSDISTPVEGLALNTMGDGGSDSGMRPERPGRPDGAGGPEGAVAMRDGKRPQRRTEGGPEHE